MNWQGKAALVQTVHLLPCIGFRMREALQFRTASFCIDRERKTRKACVCHYSVHSFSSLPIHTRICTYDIFGIEYFNSYREASHFSVILELQFFCSYFAEWGLTFIRHASLKIHHFIPRGQYRSNRVVFNHIPHKLPSTDFKGLHSQLDTKSCWQEQDRWVGLAAWT